MKMEEDIQIKKVLEPLTKKQKLFVKEYAKTGNGRQSALKVYDTTNENTAGAIASENLTKPNVILAVEKLITDDFLAVKHKELFDLKKIDYFTFPKSMSDEEIKEHVSASGIEVITVRESEKGKMAFYSIPDGQAISKALDMGFKIKGAFGDPNEKGETKNTYNFIFNETTKEDITEINKRIKEKLLNHENNPED